MALPMIVNETPFLCVSYLHVDDRAVRQVALVRGRFDIEPSGRLELATDQSQPWSRNSIVFRSCEIPSVPTDQGLVPPTLLLRDRQRNRRIFLGRDATEPRSRQILGTRSEVWVFDMTALDLAVCVSGSSMDDEQLCVPLEVRLSPDQRAVFVVWFADVRLWAPGRHEVLLCAAIDDAPPTERSSHDWLEWSHAS